MRSSRVPRRDHTGPLSPDETPEFPAASRRKAGCARRRRITQAFIWSMAFLLGGLLAASQASAQVKTEFSAEPNKGFARMVFKFERLPKYKHKISESIFVLNFAEPIDVVLKPVLAIPEYVGVARMDPDGLAVRFALTGNFNVNLMEAGNNLFVDLLPKNWTGLPPALPKKIIEELSRKALAAEKEAQEKERQRSSTKTVHTMKVRVGQHPTFTRIVFEWNKFAAAKLSRKGLEVSLQFDQIAEVDIARLKADPPRFLRGAKAGRSKDGIEIILTTDPEVEVRGFREGLTYVVDLTGPKIGVTLSTEVSKRTKEAAAIAAEAVKAKADSKEKTEIGDGKTEKIRLPATAPAKKDKSSPAPGPEFGIAKTPYDPMELKPEAFGDWETSTTVTSVDGASDSGAARSETEKAAVRPKMAARPKAKTGNNESAAKKKRVAPAPAQSKAPSASQTSIKVHTAKVGDSLKVTFPFEAPAPAAIFRRSRTIWLVFETAIPIKLGDIKKLAGGMVEKAELMSRSGVQIVRIALSRPWLTYASRQNESWIVNIGNMVTGKTEPLSLRRGLRSDKRSIVTIALKDPGRVHWFDDPEIGDRLAVVTALGPPRSLIKSQDFVEFRALATAHGIAITPRADDLAVRLRVDEVMLTRQDGLMLSAGQAHQYKPGSKALDRSKKSRPALLDIEVWQQGGPERFASRAGELERAIASAEDKDKNKLRLELTRLFVSHNLAAEALGVIRQMTNADGGAKDDPVLNILAGVANLWLGRLREAHKQLSVHALANDKDAALWRSQVYARDKKWEEALKNFHDGQDAITSYPLNVQAEFRLGAARAALQLRRLNLAADLLDTTTGVRLPTHVAADAGLMRGRYFEQIGQVEDAIAAYNRIIQGDVRPLAAEAELRRISLELKTDRIKLDGAINRLERLRISWRGDETELGTLGELANLYVKQGKYRQAFSTMKTAVLAFPRSQSALKIQDEMKQVFNELFLHGKADFLQPVASLSLFYDFREMTPVGRNGDEMIRHLANRLISVDLLDQAAELLDHQVNKRLKGAARAQVSTRLAMVHLMNRKPALALRSIRLTRQPNLPQSLKRRRDMLEARALGELGRVEAAIDILDSLKGPEVEILKADALWNAQQWAKAGRQLEKMLGTRWQEKKRLDAGERFDVLRAAVSYSLASNQFALDRMRKKFYQHMVKSPDAEAFILVSKPVKVKGRAFKTLAKEIAGVDTLEAFMKTFRKRYDKSFRPRKSSGVMTEGAKAKPLG